MHSPNPLHPQTTALADVRGRCGLLRRSKSSRPRGQRGVALIEALVSILVFSFGVLGLLGLEAQAINFSVNAEDRTRASLLASEIASYLWVNNTVTPTTAQQTTWNNNANLTNNPQGGLNAGTATVRLTANTTNSADIKITWTQQSDPTAAVVLQTLTTRVTIPGL